MITNSLDVTNLKMFQELYLVRYSQSPQPDYIVVLFHSYNEKTRSVSYTTDAYSRIKKIPYGKAVYRLFVNMDEMVRSLYDCYLKRNITMVDYKDLMQSSIEHRPEIWI